MARFDRGWIKLHRSAIEGDIGGNAYCLALFVRLLCWANLKPTIARFNGAPREVPRGALVVGIRDLAEKIGCGKDTVYRQLIYLEKRDTIRREVATEGSLITVINFERYQTSDEESEREPDAVQTPAEREPTPIEEEKKERTNTRDFDFALAEYKQLPSIQKGSKAEKRFHEQIKSAEDLTRLVTAIRNYRAFLSRTENQWRKPKTTFETFLGSKSSGYFWRDFAEMSTRTGGAALKQNPLSFGEEEDGHAADVRSS